MEKNIKPIINMSISVLLIILGCILPPFGEMTEIGMKVLFIFVTMLYGWMTIGLSWPSILGMVAIPLTGAAPVSTMWTNGFGNTTNVLLFAILFLNAYITATDAGRGIIGGLLNLKIAKGNALLMVALFLIGTYFLSIVSAGVVAVALAITIYESWAKAANIKPGEKINEFMVGSIIVIAALGNTSFSFKPEVAVVAGMIETAGVTQIAFDFGKYNLVAVPMFFVMLALLIFIGMLLRVDFSRLCNDSALEEFKVELTKEQKYCLVFVVAMLILVTIPSFLPKDFVLTTLLNRLGTPGIIIAILLLMMTIRIDGEPIITFKKLAGKFEWDIYLMFVAFLPIVGLLTSDSVGFSATLRILCEPLTTLPPYAFMAIMVLLCTIATNFINNVVAVAIFVSMSLPFMQFYPELNVHAFMCVLMYSGFNARALPSASPTSLYAYGQTQLIKPKTLLIQNLSGTVGIYLLMVTLGYWAFSIVL